MDRAIDCAIDRGADQARAEAARRDAASSLTPRRALFDLPPDIVYLDGNSLGALPAAVSGVVEETIGHQWGRRLIRSWNEAGWWDAPRRVGEQIGRLVGAAPGQVVVTDCTSVNLFKVVISAARLRPDRRIVLTDPDSFPTDLYITEAAARLAGLEMRVVPPSDAVRAIREAGADLALAAYSQVDYRTGEKWDLATITAAAHDVGALASWDLCHSAGAMEVDLDGAGADFAVGCGYKYLSGGPGAPSFLYVAARHLSSIDQPLPGWHGHARPFAMTSTYDPAPGIERMRTGSQPILAIVALEAALTAYDGVSPSELRTESLSLTTLFIDTMDRLGLIGDAGDLRLATPRDPARRGSQVSLRHPEAYAVVQALIARGVIGDFREPDIVRLGFAPLYVSHADVVRAAVELAGVLGTREYERAEFSVRATVT